MTDKQPTFPKHFLWGAATAAHQVEGGNHNQWTVWELENARALAAQAEYHISDFDSWDRIKIQAKNPHNYVSGALADHYQRYREDFAFLEKMNMNAYRFSIEWSRVEPEQGAWDVEAVTHYKEYIQELRRRGIEPVVTLLHFTLPVWFSELGGFEKRSNIKHFVRYAERIVSELGSSVKWVITINEPEIYAAAGYAIQLWPPSERNIYKTWRVVNNQATAHNRVAKRLHAMSRRYKVSVAKHSLFVYPGDNSWISRMTAWLVQYFEDDYFIKKIIKQSDFLGVNYYQSARIYGTRIHNPESPMSDIQWVMSPGDIEFVLERLHNRYHKPILITENGVADERDAHREWWIRETLTGLQAAMKREVKLLGYLHWSLMDNFEWAHGKWPRFGLVAVDYATGKRTLRPSSLWFGKVIKKLRGI